MSEDNNNKVGASTIVANILYQFEKAFSDGKNPELEEYLQGEGESRQRLLVELLHSQLELSLRAGQPLRLRDILAKYPEVAQRPDDLFSLLSSEISGLRQRGEQPVFQEYQADFEAILGTRLKQIFEQRDSTGQDNNLGKVIGGRYTLIKALGQGGMGTVFLAEQSVPVKRQVALKLIKSGVDFRSYITRFEAERQALAIMDHPNIARVYDGGMTAQQQPYFVMELVNGIPITQYCDQHRLSPKARLELFVLICLAVQHAHQKGIIHRDLKPSNVLVTEVDGKPVPKVIDFGLAKATEQRLTDESIEERGAVGTPAYMSPEQADPENLDVDTRTDVYALGVILYELLTGFTPIDVKEFRRGALLEMLRMVREVDPPKPSTKLSSAEALPSIAANRALEPKQLLAWVRGDVDWIVMKALEKDRDRRYETANGFAADVMRYLNGEAVLAHPPSRLYRVRKLVRRHRVQVVSAVLLFATLVAGIMGTTWGLLQAQEQERQAREGEKKTEAALANAVKKEAETASILRWVRGRVFAVARPIGQEGGLGHDVSLLKALEASLPSLSEDLSGHPLTEADLRQELARSFHRMGKLDTARDLYQSASELYSRHAGPDAALTIKSLNDIAVCFIYLRQPEKAINPLEKVLSALKAKHGNDNIETLGCMVNLASCYNGLLRHDDAVKLLEDALPILRERFSNHQFTLNCMDCLANTYSLLSRFDEAIKLHIEEIALCKKLLPENHPEVLESLQHLAQCYLNAGKHSDGLKVLNELVPAMKSILGADHTETLRTLEVLARCHGSIGDHEASVKCYEEVLPLMKSNSNGFASSDIFGCMVNLAIEYAGLGRHSDAIKLCNEALPQMLAKLPDHDFTFICLETLAKSYSATRRFDDALKLRKEAVSYRKNKLGENHPRTLTCMCRVAKSYIELGNTQDAKTVVRQLEELMKDSKSQLESELHNELRHSYGVFGDQRSAMRHCDAIFKSKCMDNYTLTCLTGDIKQDRKKAIHELQKIIQEYSEYKHLCAASKLTLAILADDGFELQNRLRVLLSEFELDPELTEYQSATKALLKTK